MFTLLSKVFLTNELLGAFLLSSSDSHFKVASASELVDLFGRSSMTFATYSAESEVTSLILYCHGLPIQYQHNQKEAASLSCTPSLFELLVVGALFVSRHLFFETLFWQLTLHDPSRRDFHR